MGLSFVEINLTTSGRIRLQFYNQILLELVRKAQVKATRRIQYCWCEFEVLPLMLLKLCKLSL